MKMRLVHEVNFIISTENMAEIGDNNTVDQLELVRDS